MITQHTTEQGYFVMLDYLFIDIVTEVSLEKLFLPVEQKPEVPV